MAAPIRFLSGRNQQQKIGIEGSTENQKVLEVVGRVGIGTTIFEPDSELEVRGDVIVSGELTVGDTTFGVDFSTRNLSVSGVSTFTGAIDANGDLDVDGHTELDDVNVSGVSTFTGAIDANGDLDVDGHTELDDVNVSGAITATTFTGNLTGIASTATKLETSRNFSISGDFVTASSISFDGTGDVSLGATIATNSIGLGTYTTGDYVKSISGTGNEITVTSGTGEGSTPVISIPDNPTLPGTTVTIATDLQVNRNLNVTGNITIGGTTAFVDVERLRITDADIILGYRTDSNNNDASNDTTASHGGVAVASTEGSPLISLIGAGETLPATYKKIMWFQSGAFTGLATDSWLTNYAFGVGTTSMSAGTKFAVGNIETDFDDITSVRNINASGIVTATNGFIGSLTGTATTANNLSNGSNITEGTINDARLPDLITSNIDAFSGVSTFIGLKVGTAITMSAGIITATKFVGDGSELTDITASQVGALSGVIIREEGGSSLGSVGDINFISSNLTATASGAAGTITLSDTPTFTSTVIGTGVTINSSGINATTGIITASSFIGDGSGLSGISGGTAFDENETTNQSQTIPFYVSTATTDVAGVSTQSFVFNPSTKSLGIGTDAPTSSLHVVGDAKVTGIVTASTLVSNVADGTSPLTVSSTTLVTNLNADKLDGVDSTSFLRSDAADIKTSGNLRFNNSVEATFGNSDDLRIYHESGYSYIIQEGTNNLVIEQTTDDVDVVIKSDDGSGSTTNYFVADGSTGEAILYHYGSQKLATKDGGIEVTGIVTATTFSGALSGNATSATTATTATNVTVTANNSTNETVYPVFVDGATGSQGAETDTGLSYNPSTNTFTAGTFSGSGSSLTDIPNGALTNSSIAIGGVTLNLGDTDATPAFDLSDATAYPYTSLTGITTEILGDTTPQLGGNLDLNSKFISGTGGISVTGIVTATSLDAAISEWVLGANGSSDYTFTGPGLTGAENDPSIYLVRGQKYNFKNSSGGHPFRIQSTPNGSTGTQYNDGITNNDAGNGVTLTWDVQFDAPGVLYYQCTSHGGMGGKIYIGNSGESIVVGAAVTINSSGINATGVVTATSFVGDGSTLTGIAAGGSGEFNTGITSSRQIVPLSFESTVFTFPSTAGRQYVIESINVANVDASVGLGTTVNIIASIQDATAAEQTYIAYNVPIVTGGLIELLKNPIVAGPSDVIKMWSTNDGYTGVSNAAEVYMSYSEFESTDYISKFASTTTINSTDAITLYTSTSNPTAIEKIGFANRTDTGDFPISIKITNGTTTSYLAKDLIIPRYSTVDILDRPKRIETGAKIEVEVGSTSTVDVIISGKKITS